MFYRRITPILAAVGVALTPGTWASDIGLVDRRLQEDVGMSLFPRQDEVGLNNLNIFTDTLGGAEAPPILHSSDPLHPYEVGSDVASDFETAIEKACDAQKNACADLANGALRGQLSVSDCDDQSSKCKSFLQASATQTAFLSKVTLAGDNRFDFLCEN